MPTLRLTYRPKTDAIGVHVLNPKHIMHVESNSYLYNYLPHHVEVTDEARRQLLLCPFRSGKHGLEFFSKITTIGWASLTDTFYVPLDSVSVADRHLTLIRKFLSVKIEDEPPPEAEENDDVDNEWEKWRILWRADRARMLRKGPWRLRIGLLQSVHPHLYVAEATHPDLAKRECGSYATFEKAHNAAIDAVVMLNRHGEE